MSDFNILKLALDSHDSGNILSRKVRFKFEDSSTSKISVTKDQIIWSGPYHKWHDAFSEISNKNY